jgi:hypothetical protein
MARRIKRVGKIIFVLKSGGRCASLFSSSGVEEEEIMSAVTMRFLQKCRRAKLCHWILFLTLFAGLIASSRVRAQESAQKCPPAARVDDAKDTYGTTVVADPYRWLEDQNSPETRAWINAEQKCTDTVLS